MKISFFSVNDYGSIIGKELQKRGYNVQFNALNKDTDIVFVFGADSSFIFNRYLLIRNELEGYIYKGKIIPIVLDIPYWRLDKQISRAYYKYYRNFLKAAYKCVTISKQTSQQLKNIWNIDSTPLFSVFNDKLVDKYKKKLKRKKQIIMVSRFVSHKRFDLVMKAIQGTDWKLIMCGISGDLYDYYKGIAESLNIDYEIHLNPSYEFIVEKYCDSQVCIQPSIFEGLSLVPKEALWCNTPVILADIEVNKEFHSDFVDYFKTDDLEDLKRVLNSKLKPVNKKHIEKLRIKNVTTQVEKWIQKNC